MFKNTFAPLRFTFVTFVLSSLLLTCLVVTPQAQQPAPRRPLPKPSAGARGFEQYAARDASSRLIAAGATRDIEKPRIPFAPLLGLAYDARPFFAWSPALDVDSPSYHFVLYDGDVGINKAAKTIYETDVTKAELVYPATAPALAPGKLYSWRVMSMEDGSNVAGPAVSFFVLSKADAAAVKGALTRAKSVSPQTTPEQLKRAEIFADYGVWYDAFRIVNDLEETNPDDEAVTNYNNKLMEQLKASQDAQVKASLKAQTK